MVEELEKTCENCKYENEDMEGTHCRHCIHNAEEHFEPKEMSEKEIYNQAITEFAERLKYEIRNCSWQFSRLETETIDRIAEEMRGAE